jgi:hypothetical protein
MFDENKRQSLNTNEGAAPGGRFVFKGLPITDLVKYHDEIRALLPPLTLKEIDLEGELLMQFHATRSVQNEVFQDDEVPVNQRAQIANTVGTTLNRLAELQTSIYTSERFKRIENLLVRTLKALPEDQALKFLESYEKILGESG